MMILDYIKAQLQRLITHLMKLDVSVLVQEAGSIRQIFNNIKDDLPALEQIIQPATFLEGNSPKFLSAQSRLAA